MRVPTLRRNTSSNQGFIEFQGRREYLGVWGKPETIEAYHRRCAEIVSGKPHVDPKTPITVSEMVLAFLEHCERIYTDKSGGFTSEYGRAKSAMRPLVRLYGSLPASDFGPSGLRVLQEAWIAEKREDEKTPRVCRKTVNTYTSIIRRCYKWAASRELLDAEVWHALQAVEPVRAGRTTARESRDVKPVEDAHIDAVLPFVSRQVRAIIELLRLTGARPSEILTLRPADLDTSGDVWTAAIRDHKNAHRGKARTIYFGPKAIAILKPFMLRPADAFLFSPQEAEAERLAARHEARVTPDGQGNEPGTNKKRRPEREPGPCYDRHSLRKAIERACVKAEVEKWNPYQLRHARATQLRRTFGLDAAGVILGHSNLDVTQVYAAADEAKAREIMARIG